MEILAVVFSILAVTLAVIALTTMVLDAVHRSSLLEAMEEQEQSFEQATKALGEAHNNIVGSLKSNDVRLETIEMQIRSLTLGTQAPKRGF